MGGISFEDLSEQELCLLDASDAEVLLRFSQQGRNVRRGGIRSSARGGFGCGLLPEKSRY